jgi:hypothetical protein
MRTAPRSKPDSLQQQYDGLLADSIKKQDDYLRWLGQANDWWRGGKKDIAQGLREGLVEHQRPIINSLRARAQLLREINGLRTMDAVVAELDAGTAATAGDAVKSMFDNARRNGVDVSKDDTAFFAARKALAESMGYTIEEDDGEWFTVSRHNVLLEMKLSRMPTANGVTGNDRIDELHVSADVAGSPRTVAEYRRSDDSFLPCADPMVQNEIDRAIAVFG